jgi:hypothetical protein
MEKQFKLSVIPTKMPGKNPTISSWKQYENYCSPAELWHDHYKNSGGVGIICGKVSGNLECIDIDIKNDPQKTVIDEFRKLIPDDLYNKLVVQTTPSGGQHYIYRCPEVVIEKNLKLAHHSDHTVIIETRGEGGYFCSSKNHNKIISGILDLENLHEEIQSITPSERMFLLESARALTRYFEPPKLADDGTAFKYKEERINKFNREFEGILEIFTKASWKIIHDDGEKVSILRPGSSALHSGYYFKESKIFYSFSSSTRFKENQPHNHFQILQVLEGNNDYRTTLNLLTGLGYPSTEVSSNDGTQRVPRISHADVIKYLGDNGVYYDSFIQEIMQNGIPINDRMNNALYIKMIADFNQNIRRPMYEDAINSSMIPQFHPILDFIERNKDINTTGNFEKWLDCIELDKEEFRPTLVHFFRKFYVGLVAQALDGPYPNEFFLSLLSLKQGVGKTTLLRDFTLPQEFRKYITETSLTYSDDYKVLMGQTILMLDDEMDGRTYESEKTLKSILSVKETKTRRKYDRRMSTIKRRCSFCGSGNELSVIRDLGNRRIIPIEVADIDRVKIREIDQVALFMEAYNLFKAGFVYTYEYGDNDILNSLNSEYIGESDLNIIISEFIELPTSEEDKYVAKIYEMSNALRVQHPHAGKMLSSHVLGKALTQKGFKSKRIGREKHTVYTISSESPIIKLIEPEDTVLFGSGTISIKRN